MKDTPKEFAMFAKLLEETASLYNQKLSASQIRTYWTDLAAYSLDAVAQGLKRHRLDPDRCQFMPKPGDIVAGTASTSPHPDDWYLRAEPIDERMWIDGHGYVDDPKEFFGAEGGNRISAEKAAKMLGDHRRKLGDIVKDQIEGAVRQSDPEREAHKAAARRALDDLGKRKEPERI